MTPADVQALIEKWRGTADAAEELGHLGEAWSIREHSDEIEALFASHAQALEALRDKWREEVKRDRYLLKHEEDGPAESFGRGHAAGMAQCADDLDVLLHGAGGLHDQEKKDDLARMGRQCNPTTSRTAPTNEAIRALTDELQAARHETRQWVEEHVKWRQRAQAAEAEIERLSRCR